MRWEVVCKPSYSLLKVYLESPGEELTAEPGAMAVMRGPVRIKTHTGGIGRALMRAIAGGESVWLNTFIAEGPSEVWIAPKFPGDISYFQLDGSNPLIIADTSYLASHGNVSISVAWRGFKGLLAGGGGLVWLKAEGVGGVWVSSYGGIERIDLAPGERTIIDNFHFVAMTQSVRWKVRKFGGLKSAILGGEGLVMEVEGPGTVYVSTRSSELMRLLERAR